MKKHVKMKELDAVGWGAYPPMAKIRRCTKNSESHWFIVIQFHSDPGKRICIFRAIARGAWGSRARVPLVGEKIQQIDHFTPAILRIFLLYCI